MKVLVGGEFTGTIRDAFIRHGHDAMSCDLTRDTVTPGPHYVGDWRDIWDHGYDLAVFHPTCTYMANSGSLRLYNKGKKGNGLNVERWVNMGLAAWDFWYLLNHCPIPRIAVENPIMLRYAQLMVGRTPNQTIQPYEFGDDASKATCLWLENLPKLVPTKRVSGRMVQQLDGRIVERWSNQTDSGQNKETPTDDPEDRRMKRSAFFPGVADAMASQWGSLEV